MTAFMGILVTNGDSFTYGDELPGSRVINEQGVYNPTHQHHTFTHKLADHLGTNYVNLAHNGSSNQKIFRRTTTFLQQTSKKIDYLVIIWSSWGRLEVVGPQYFDQDKKMFIQKECNMNQIIPDHRQSLLKFDLRGWADTEEVSNAAIGWYQHVYNFQTAIVHQLNYMTTIQHLCDVLGIKVIQGVIHHGLWTNLLGTLNDAAKVENRGKYNQYVEYVQDRLEYLRPECKLGFGDKRDMTSIAQSPDNDFFIYPYGHPCQDTHTYYADMLNKIFREM